MTTSVPNDSTISAGPAVEDTYKAGPAPMPETTKITATLPNDVVDDLRELAKERRLTLSAALREAITTSKFLSDETKANGKLLIEKGDGELRQIVFR